MERFFSPRNCCLGSQNMNLQKSSNLTTPIAKGPQGPESGRSCSEPPQHELGLLTSRPVFFLPPHSLTHQSRESLCIICCGPSLEDLEDPNIRQEVGFRIWSHTCHWTCDPECIIELPEPPRSSGIWQLLAPTSEIVMSLWENVCPASVAQ